MLRDVFRVAAHLISNPGNIIPFINFMTQPAIQLSSEYVSQVSNDLRQPEIQAKVHWALVAPNGISYCARSQVNRTIIYPQLPCGDYSSTDEIRHGKNLLA